MTREDWLTDALIRFLDRRSVPRALDGEAKAQARADETRALVRAVFRHAPGTTYEAWWDRLESQIAENVPGRSWPSESDMAEAARALRAVPGLGCDGTQGDSGDEPAIVQMLAEWFSKHSTQAPGLGRSTRTAELIRRGVLRDEREARFRGFDLSEEQRRRAVGYTDDRGERHPGQRMGRAEWDHHVAVMARRTRFAGKTMHEVEHACASDLEACTLPEFWEHLGWTSAPPAIEEPARGFRRMDDPVAQPERAEPATQERFSPLDEDLGADASPDPAYTANVEARSDDAPHERDLPEEPMPSAPFPPWPDDADWIPDDGAPTPSEEPYPSGFPAG